MALMARPSIEPQVELKVKIPPALYDHLLEIAQSQLIGPSVTDVARHILVTKINEVFRELCDLKALAKQLPRYDKTRSEGIRSDAPEEGEPET